MSKFAMCNNPMLTTQKTILKRFPSLMWGTVTTQGCRELYLGNVITFNCMYTIITVYYTITITIHLQIYNNLTEKKGEQPDHLLRYALAVQQRMV